MKTDRVISNEKSQISNEDHWFDSNLRCLLGGEIALIKKGTKKEIDRKMLAEWILKRV